MNIKNLKNLFKALEWIHFLFNIDPYQQHWYDQCFKVEVPQLSIDATGGIVHTPSHPDSQKVIQNTLSPKTIQVDQLGISYLKTTQVV